MPSFKISIKEETEAQHVTQKYEFQRPARSSEHLSVHCTLKNTLPEFHLIFTCS